MAIISGSSPPLSFHSLLLDNMVLQRDIPSVIWGNAAANSIIDISLDDSEMYSVMPDSSGSWQIELSPHSASTNHVISATQGNQTIQIENVAFGDVFFCSGQSNMEMSVNAASDADYYINEADKFGNIRFFTVARDSSLTPVDGVVSKDPRNMNAWNIASHDTVSGPDHFSYPSATCYFTMRALYLALNSSVPIGFVASDWGGTVIEAWSSPDALSQCIGSENTSNGTDDGYWTDDHDDDDGGYGDAPSPETPSALWNGMVNPILPFRFKGALWYQGEANDGNAAPYACRFPRMIEDWRNKFQSDLPFFFVQLAAYPEAGDHIPSLRQAQLAALQLPNTGFATAIDLGDPDAPDGSIHPRSKPEVGHRLFLSLWAKLYKHHDTVYQGPVIDHVIWPADDDDTTILIAYENSTASQGMHLSGTAYCTNCCKDIPFVVIMKDGSSQRARASVGQLEVKVFLESAPDSPIAGLQYNFENVPQCALYNSAGLPAVPFSITRIIQPGLD